MADRIYSDADVESLSRQPLSASQSFGSSNRTTQSSDQPKTIKPQTNGHNQYPQHGPLYKAPNKIQITGDMHFVPEDPNEDGRFPLKETGLKPKYLIDGKDHFIKDYNYNSYAPNEFKEEASINERYNPDSTLKDSKDRPYVFSAATTIVNQENDPDKQHIIDYGLEDAEYKKANPYKNINETIYTYQASSDTLPPPISPWHPFTRIADPTAAQSIINYSYNRYQYPIADLEHRKAFRNVFFTRPECYIVCRDKNQEHNPYNLARQCELDDDIRSSVMRMPHISKMLSPVYVSGTFGSFPKDNFNYLISNRIKGFNVDPFVLSVNESNTKSIEGFTVNTGMHMESNQGGTVTISFRDTKYLEVSEYFRLWMLYIYKRKKGVLEPPFAKYDYANDFPAISNNEITAEDKAYWLHPYDRAIEYTCSMFDFVTNESNDRVLYWSKYYGMFPTNMSISGLSNESGGALTEELTVEVQFRYQYKTVCTNHSLVEFNINAGITDLVGRVTSTENLVNSQGYINEKEFIKMRINEREHPVPYQGASGMFVGTPYVVMGRSSIREPDKNGIGVPTIHPYLHFVGANDMVNRVGNLGISKQRNISDKMGKQIPVSTN